MKTLKPILKTGFLLLMIGLMMAPNNAYANATNTFKSKCNFWTKRYKSSARISLLLVPICVQTRKGCTTVFAQCEKSCGIVTASAGPNINFLDEWIWGFGCSGGDVSSELYSDIHKVRYNEKNEKQTNVMQTTLRYENDFDMVNRKYIVKNGNGFLKIDKSYAGYVGFNFKLWESTTDSQSETDEEVIDPASIFIDESIMVQDNELILSDGLRNNKGIVVEELADFFLVRLVDFYQEFDIPEGVDMDNVSANVSAMSESDTDRLTKEQLAEENAIEVFPNPSNGDFTIQLGKTIDTNVEIKLYNVQGALVKSFGTFQGITKGQNISISASNMNLPNGNYIISVVGDGIIEINKIVIQR